MHMQQQFIKGSVLTINTIQKFLSSQKGNNIPFGLQTNPDQVALMPLPQDGCWGNLGSFHLAVNNLCHFSMQGQATSDHIQLSFYPMMSSLPNARWQQSSASCPNSSASVEKLPKLQEKWQQFNIWGEGGTPHLLVITSGSEAEQPEVKGKDGFQHANNLFECLVGM